LPSISSQGSEEEDSDSGYGESMDDFDDVITIGTEQIYNRLKVVDVGLQLRYSFGPDVDVSDDGRG
jgi:hypothetical protein